MIPDRPRTQRDFPLQKDRGFAQGATPANAVVARSCPLRMAQSLHRMHARRPPCRHVRGQQSNRNRHRRRDADRERRVDTQIVDQVFCDPLTPERKRRTHRQSCANQSQRACLHHACARQSTRPHDQGERADRLPATTTHRSVRLEATAWEKHPTVARVDRQSRVGIRSTSPSRTALPLAE
jgi:hypothetical protein